MLKKENENFEKQLEKCVNPGSHYLGDIVIQSSFKLIGDKS